MHAICKWGVLLGVVAAPGFTDDLVFLHHSVGQNWLDHSLREALLGKSYVDAVNEFTYGTEVDHDGGRPGSLGEAPGEYTDMNHWILWFNDYVEHILSFADSSGTNRIVLFKSCFPNSHIWDSGTEPGDPFSGDFTLANFRAIYRHPNGPGHTYTYEGREYKPLEDVFAEHPDVLFVPITSPPLHYAWADATDDDAAHRARLFNTWLKETWLAEYDAAHPGLKNVAVFDLFNELAYSDSRWPHPNRLRQEYGGARGDSHPNSSANAHLTAVFATNPGNFLDSAWIAFGGTIEGEGEGESEGEGEGEGESSGCNGSGPLSNPSIDDAVMIGMAACVLAMAGTRHGRARPLPHSTCVSQCSPVS